MAQIQARESRKDDPHLLGIRHAIASWKETPRSNISGIANQGATCYLNTLLQTLLHTTDLTSRLFTMAKETQTTKLKRIVQELLVLFYNLLNGNGEAVSAKPLTDSFGWNSHEVLVHQDIQELNRLLFEQLEKNLKDTSEKTLICDLYKGVLHTRIKCLKCGRLSERNDEFQDVNLSVSDCDSVEAALRNHTQTEKLFGDNQYFCEQCKCRVDATKSSRFTELPLILTLSLSRFYFDAKTMEACKLDKMCSFPMLLDMTDYLSGKQKEAVTYDLFSIVIHAGAAACGGHYHAYIKDPYGYTGKAFNGEPSRNFNISNLKERQSRRSQSSNQTNTNYPTMLYPDTLSHPSVRNTTTTAQRLRTQSQRRSLHSHRVRTQQLLPATPASNQYSQHQSLVRCQFQRPQTADEVLSSCALAPRRPQGDEPKLVAIRTTSTCPPQMLGKGRRPPAVVPTGLATRLNSRFFDGSCGSMEAKPRRTLQAKPASQPVTMDSSRHVFREDSVPRRQCRELGSSATSTGSTARQHSAYPKFFPSMKATILPPQRGPIRTSSTFRLSTSTLNSQAATPSPLPSGSRGRPQCPSPFTCSVGPKPLTTASKTPQTRFPNSQTLSDCTIDIEMSDKSDWAEPCPKRDAFTTSLNNDNKELFQMRTSSGKDTSQSQKTSTDASENPAWKSRLFGYNLVSYSAKANLSPTPTGGESLTSSDSAREEDERVENIEAEDKGRVSGSTPVIRTKDSLSLNKNRKVRGSSVHSSPSTESSDGGSLKTRKGVDEPTGRQHQSESDDRCCTPKKCSVPVPCGALRMTRGDREAGNPVVYGKWFDFNDDLVSEVKCESFERVFKGTECAYMLFYKRTGQSAA